MSIRALRSFIAIARYGSFAAASQKLGLTQAAVSLQVKKLEDELDTPLFDRSGHKPLLNFEGQRLLDEAITLVDHYDSLRGILHNQSVYSGQVVIGSINTVQVSPLPLVLQKFRNDHPYLQVSIKSGLSAELTTAVDLGQLDFAITTEPVGILPPQLCWEAFSSETFYVVAPKEFVENNARDLLQNHPYVCFDRLAWAGRLVEKKLNEAGIVVHQSMELDSLDATLQMARASLGVAIVSLSEKRRQELLATMKVIPFEGEPFYRRIGVVYKSASRWAPVAMDFRTRLADAIS